MDSSERKILFVTGKEEIRLVESLINDELFLEPMKEELTVLRMVETLYRFPNQTVYVLDRLSTPNGIRDLKRVMEAFGDKENNTFFVGYCNAEHRYWARVIDNKTVKYTGVQTAPVWKILP